MPYLLDRPGLGHHVQGEVYQVDDDMLALLGTIHILRKHMLGRGGLKNSNFCLFLALENMLKYGSLKYVLWGWGSKKPKNVVM